MSARGARWQHGWSQACRTQAGGETDVEHDRAGMVRHRRPLQQSTLFAISEAGVAGRSSRGQLDILAQIGGVAPPSDTDHLPPGSSGMDEWEVKESEPVRE